LWTTTKDTVVAHYKTLRRVFLSPPSLPPSLSDLFRHEVPSVHRTQRSKAGPTSGKDDPPSFPPSSPPSSHPSLPPSLPHLFRHKVPSVHPTQGLENARRADDAIGLRREEGREGGKCEWKEMKSIRMTHTVFTTSSSLLPPSLPPSLPSSLPPSLSLYLLCKFPTSSSLLAPEERYAIVIDFIYLFILIN